jgi:hypothetical protein
MHESFFPTLQLRKVVFCYGLTLLITGHELASCPSAAAAAGYAYFSNNHL